MKTIGTIIANLDKGAFFLRDGTDQYFDKLRSALIDIKNDYPAEYLHFAFVTLSSATLEYCLNHILVTWCFSEFGPKAYKEFAETYINLPFRKKLVQAPYLITKGEFLFDDNHSSFAVLSDLISLRNNLLHTKEFLQEIDASWLSLDYINSIKGDTFTVPFKYKKQHIELIDKDVCLQIAEAIGDFKNLFMVPFLKGELDVNPLLKKLVVDSTGSSSNAC